MIYFSKFCLLVNYQKIRGQVQSVGEAERGSEAIGNAIDRQGREQRHCAGHVQAELFRSSNQYWLVQEVGRANRENLQ